MDKFSKELQNVVSPKFDETCLKEILEQIFDVKYLVINDIIFNSASTKGSSYLSSITKFTVKGVGKDTRNDTIKDVLVHLISKVLPNNIARRKTFRSLDFFENEVIFYNKVWKSMDMFQRSKKPEGVFSNIPLCISAFTNGVHDYITLEDLSSKGFKNFERSNCLDLQHTQLVIRLFAKFHALGLAFKDQKPEEFKKIANCLQETYFSEKFRNWYVHFQRESLCNVLGDAIEKQLNQLYSKKIKELFATDFYGTMIHHCQNRGKFAVITHGDAWSPNFLFKYNDNNEPLEAFMIDFQLARYTSPALDITHFLYSSTEQSLRLEYWDSIIEDYHKTFTETLHLLGSSKNLMTLVDLKSEIKEHAIFGIGMSMETVTLSLLEEEDVAELDMIQGDEDIPLETVLFIHPFNIDEKRQRLANIFKHAVDNGFV